jgi:hypothetical protein
MSAAEAKYQEKYHRSIQEKRSLIKSYNTEVGMIVVESQYDPRHMRSSANKTFMSAVMSENSNTPWVGLEDHQWKDVSLVILENGEKYDLLMFVPGHEELDADADEHEENEMATAILRKYVKRKYGELKIRGTAYIVQARHGSGSGVFKYEDMSEENVKKVLEVVMESS